MHASMLVRAPARVMPLLVALGLAGCLSNEPGSRSTARVVVEHAPPERVQAELVRVFGDEQYRVITGKGRRLVFERPATQRDQVMFGTFMSEVMEIRVEVTTDPYRTDSTLVCADAYVILDGEVDRRIGVVGSHHYQSLLKRAKASVVSSDPN